jgi:hypothetical protein
MEHLEVPALELQFLPRRTRLDRDVHEDDDFDNDGRPRIYQSRSDCSDGLCEIIR